MESRVGGDQLSGDVMSMDLTLHVKELIIRPVDSALTSSGLSFLSCGLLLVILL